MERLAQADKQKEESLPQVREGDSSTSPKDPEEGGMAMSPPRRQTWLSQRVPPPAPAPKGKPVGVLIIRKKGSYFCE